jgi:CRISPR-associated protein Csd1
VSLDKERTDVAYLLGRLFAVLEKVQEESAGGKLNASIKDKYFASASTHPSVTFPLLIRLSQNHQKKLKTERAGRAVNFQKEIQSIISNLDSFPSYLNLEDQGLFAIGYYHQYQSFFEKRETETTDNNNGAEE